MRVDEFAVLLVNLFDDGQAVAVQAFAGNEAVFIADFVQREGEVEAFACADFRPQRFDFRRIPSGQVENEAFEVGRFGNVHRRAGGNVGVRGGARTVGTGFEKLVQYVVFVGGDHQAADRQAHLFGDVSGADVAEVAAGHAEADGFVIALRRFEIAGEVVNHLCHHASPVDAVDRADAVFLFEGGIVLNGFYNVLAVVKHAVHGDVVDVFVLQAVHLRALERAHFAFRRHHEHMDAFLAAQGVFGSRTGVAAGGADDVQGLPFAFQNIFKGVAQKLHGHVFEGQCGAVGQGLDFQAV